MCAKSWFRTIIYAELWSIIHFPRVNPLLPGLKLLETSTILSLWVVCHGHSDFGRYPLVGPVGIPRTWLIVLLKIILAGSSPGLHGTSLYSLCTMGMCRWTGYGLLPLCRKGYMISWEFVNRVFPAGLIWFARWILFVLQVHKSNDYNVPCSLAIANKWFYNKTAFILFFVLNRLIKLRVLS